MDTRAPIKRYESHGLVLKSARIRAKLTQRDVSTATDIPISMIKEYEQGRCMPSVERELRLINLLGIDLLDLDRPTLMRVVLA